MSNSPPKSSLAARTQNEHADFNWPPSDEELAQYVNIAGRHEVPQGGVARVPEAVDAQRTIPQPVAAIASSAPRETLAGPLETSVPVPAAPVTRDLPQAASVAERSEAAAKHSGVDDSTTSNIAVAKNDPALEETQRGDWVAEIASLQALIEALTEKVEWRISNAI